MNTDKKKSKPPKKLGAFIFFTFLYLVSAGIFLFRPFIASLLLNNIILAAFTLLYFIFTMVFFMKKSNKDKSGISFNFENSESSRQANFSEGRDSLKEMAFLYSKMGNRNMKTQINELMLISDKIIQAAKKDKNAASDAKKFFSYYLPTTIKLLKAYLNIEDQEFKGENSIKSKENIEKMLETAIEAYKRQLDSLFENQAIDIDAEISVMNNMLRREGLIKSEFQDVIKLEKDAAEESGNYAEQTAENITQTSSQK